MNLTAAGLVTLNIHIYRTARNLLLAFLTVPDKWSAVAVNNTKKVVAYNASPNAYFFEATIFPTCTNPCL